jgi:phenylpyruvate tautomerase PptA (4-oxalocrotonate tautomerase family)
MPQVKIHVAGDLKPPVKALLAKEIRDCMPPILGIPENIGQVFLYETSTE